MEGRNQKPREPLPPLPGEGSLTFQLLRRILDATPELPKKDDANPHGWTAPPPGKK